MHWTLSRRIFGLRSATIGNDTAAKRRAARFRRQMFEADLGLTVSFRIIARTSKRIAVILRIQSPMPFLSCISTVFPLFVLRVTSKPGALSRFVTASLKSLHWNFHTLWSVAEAASAAISKHFQHLACGCGHGTHHLHCSQIALTSTLSHFPGVPRVLLQLSFLVFRLFTCGDLSAVVLSSLQSVLSVATASFGSR